MPIWSLSRISVDTMYVPASSRLIALSGSPSVAQFSRSFKMPWCRSTLLIFIDTGWSNWRSIVFGITRRRQR